MGVCQLGVPEHEPEGDAARKVGQNISSLYTRVSVSTRFSQMQSFAGRAPE
jgi:hypothetical protein